MSEQAPRRRLAAILAADVVGYSRMMQADEAGTLAALKSRRAEILQPLVARYHGRVVKFMGDGVLVEFASAVDAVECAVALQRGMAEVNRGLADDRHIVLRVGINLGDVMVEGGDLYGDGVNIAARIEGIAEPGGILISGSAYDQVKNKIDIGFEDVGSRNLKNISETIRIYRPRLDRQAADAPAAFTPADKPSIAVLPFVNMSGDPEQEYFVDGLTEDITTALSRIGLLWVIARTSTFTYKGKSTDVKHVARELGVRYVMEGSARRAGDRLRVTVQLIDAITGHHVWAERYDRPVTDLFEVQDDITRSVAASTETQVHLAEGAATVLRPSGNLRARDLLARATSRMYDQTVDAFVEASELVEEAIRIDPLNFRAHFLRGAIFVERMYFGVIPHTNENVATALALARQVLRLGPRDELAHFLMSEAYGEAGQLEDAVAECERGLEINPNSSMILGNLGAYLAALGQTEKAIEACRFALRLNPRDPANFWRHINIAIAHFIAGDYEAAMEESKRVARSRSHLSSGIIWAAAAAGLNRSDEAQLAVEHCLAERPDLRISGVVPVFLLRFARDEDYERLLTLLRKAGLPE
jgi:TolB-like protein/Tfp pilus assembly protein PilF